MDIKSFIQTVIKDNNLSYKALAEKMGYKRPSTISNIVMRNDARISMIYDICEELDYEIVIRPKHGTNKSERSYIIDEMNNADDNRTCNRK